MNYKTSNEFFNCLNFHDCPADKIIIEKETISFDFEYVYVSEKHPLNPYGVAKSTGRSRLTFNGVIDSHVVIYFSEGLEKQVPITDLEKMEFLEVVQKPSENYYTFEIRGIGFRTNDFCKVEIKANSFTLQWNELTKDAWYVGWNEIAESFFKNNQSADGDKR